MFKQLVQQITHWFWRVLPQDTHSLSKGRHQLLLRWLMPNGGTLILLLLYIGISRTWSAPASNPPLLTSATEINFSGYLADDNSNPLTGNYDITIAIYSQPTPTTGETPLWGPEPHLNVPVTEGNWTVGIGSVLAGGVPTTLWSGNRYLQITVEGEVLSPRQLIRSVPIAGLALTVPDASIDSRKMAPQWYNTHNPATVSTSSTTQVATGVTLSFTCDIDCVALIVHRGLIANSLEHGRVNVHISVDGQPVFREYGLSGVPGGDLQRRFGSVSGSRMVNLDAGTHTASVSFACSPSSPGICEYFGDASGDWEELTVLLFAQTP